MMYTSNSKVNSQKPSMISNLIQLKLMESTNHSSHYKSKIEEHCNKAAGFSINTPSTIDDFRKFRSCDLNKKSKQP